MGASKKGKKDMFETAAQTRDEDDRVVDLAQESERRAEKFTIESDAKVERKLRRAGSWAVWFSFFLSLCWLGGVGAFLAGYYTPEELLALPLPIAGGGVLMICGVAMLIWFAGFIVRETAQARAMARRLSAAADILLAPAAAGEASTKRLGSAIRAELAQLDRVVNETAGRLKALEQAVSSQSRTLIGAVNSVETQSKSFGQAADSLDSKAKLIEDIVTRHTQRVGDAFGAAQSAARDIEGRVVATSESLKASAEAILAKSEQLTFLAKTVNQKANQLDGALDHALKTLATASHLVDAAKASTGMATDASKTAAEAVRGAISDAIERARLVAEQIKLEHQSVEAAGKIGLDTIKQAAEAAKGATDTLTSHSQKRIQELSEQLQEAIQRADRSAEQRIEQARRLVERTGSALNEVSDRTGAKPIPLRVEPDPKGKPRGEAPKEKGQDGWRWKDVLASAEKTAAEPVPAASPVDRLSAALTSAGAAPFDTISDSRLKDILKRGAEGAAARRWAVWDAAPDALRKAKAALSIDLALRDDARAFLADESGKLQAAGAQMGSFFASPTGRVFLILDAALN